MSKEYYSNGVTGFLSGAIDNAVTSVVLADTSAFPASGNFRVKCDDEIMLVSANNTGTKTFTVTRGVEGTTAASHADTAAIYTVLTDGSLRSLVRQSHGGTLVGARREINLVDGGGVTWTLTDDGTNDKVDVSASVSVNSGFEAVLTKPSFADGWAWDNQQDATYSEPGNGLALYGHASGTTGDRALVKALPGSQYTVIMRIRPSQWGNGSFSFILKDSVNGKYQQFIFYVYSGGNRFGWNQGTSLSSLSYQDYYALSLVTDMWWVKIVEDATHRTVYLSSDGYTFIPSFQQSTGSYLTPDHAGFSVSPGSDRDLCVTLVSYTATSP